MRLIDANAFTVQYGDYYAEEGTESGFIGTVGDLISKQPTIEAEHVRHGRWIPHRITTSSMCSECKKYATHETPRCPFCGSKPNVTYIKNSTGSKTINIECNNRKCGVVLFTRANFVSDDDVIAAWNMRADDVSEVTQNDT